jgi:uncharacterized OsmC-like protein
MKEGRMKQNNVDLERLKNTAAEVSGDPAKARRTSRVEGTWNLKKGKPQFTATLTFESRTQTLEADQPGFLGGGGTRPGPVLYCLYGTAACFAATFASIAAMEGVELSELRVAVENDINFRPILGLSQEPVVEKVRLRLMVSSPTPRSRVEELEALATRRCPAVYCLTQPIPLETSLEYRQG